MKLEELLQNKYWMPSSIQYNQIIFEEISENTLNDSPFLDQRAVGKTGRTAKVPISALVEIKDVISPEGSLNHIFHISHVGSTFVSRLYDFFFEVDVYREPPIFKEIASLCRESKYGLAPFSAGQIPVLYDLACRLMMRGSTNTIVKHSSQNLIIPDFAENIKGSPRPVLFIYTSLINFLCHGISSYGLQVDATQQAVSRIRFFNQVSTLDKLSLPALSKVQLIALVWVVETTKILNRFDARRGDQLFDFDNTLKTQDRIAIVETLSNTFNLPISASKLKDINSATVWHANSKGIISLGAYDERKQAIETNAMEKKDLISEGINWVYSLCNRNIMLRSLIPHIE